jgi:hypothetical protein
MNDVASRKTDGYSVKPRPMLECSLRSLVCLWNVVGFDVSERDVSSLDYERETGVA